MRNCQKTCLIVPCYNEEKRLVIQDFIDFCSDDLVFVFVNDGSIDSTGALLQTHSSKNWHILNLKENKGKGEAIRQGALYIKSNKIDQSVSWIGFWDSDLSVPLQELQNFFRYSDMFSNDADCIIGSRVKRMGSEIHRSASRHYLGRCFCTLIAYMFSIHFYDTQCGAKLFRKELLDTCFNEPFTSNWIFDVELLLRLKEFQTVEYPLQEWREKAGSKINFSTVGFEVFADLLRIKRKVR